MVSRSTIILLILLTCAITWGADKKYYEFPDATRVRGNARILIYDPISGSRNVTAAALLSDVAATDHTHTSFGNLSANRITADSITVVQGSEAQSLQLLEALANGSNYGTIGVSDSLTGDHTLLITDSGLVFDNVAVVNTTDSRLSDARTPTIHDHETSNITNLAVVAETGDYQDLYNMPDSYQIQHGTTNIGDVLDKLLPQPPDFLSTRTLLLSAGYKARESTTGTVRSGVVNNRTPTISCSGAFGFGDYGTLYADIDGTWVGSRGLTAANDFGVYGSLEILTDVDSYAGQAGKSGFWWELTAKIVPAEPVAVKVPHTAFLMHSATGSTGPITWYSDDAVTPSVSAGPTVSGVTHTSAKHISGVECLTTNDTIQISATAANAVHSFYNNTQVIRFTSSYTTALSYLPGSAPADNATVASGTQNLVVSSGYSTAPTITATAYNSAGGTGTATTSPAIRIDTVSSESSRYLSGAGDYPSSIYGGTYDSNQLLTAAVYVNELQMINGAYQYPPDTNYTGNMPAGPNYSTGIGTSVRWVTLAFAGFSGTGRTITISGSSNFGSTAVISGLQMYARVDGSSPTAGWVDLNAAYPGVGNPTNNGDAALAPGSTATSRILTFGSTVRTGTLYLRIGLPHDSTKSFTGAS